MGSVQELDHARAELAAWLKEKPRARLHDCYFIEAYQQWRCVLREGDRHYMDRFEGYCSTEAEAIEAALKAARGRG